jgi:long-chain acyl-CoA synthetase
MNYKHSDVINGVPHPRGEICIRGSNVFKGYYKMPDKTQEALDEQGFLHTGDVGMWLPSGDLKIIDRKKNIFKLAQGEYVAPEKIENVYQRAQYVAQIFVHGESLQNELVAIVIPDVETVGSWAKKNNIAGGLKEWCQNPVVKKLILADMAASAKEGQVVIFLCSGFPLAIF